MGLLENGGGATAKVFPSPWSTVAAKPCDYCKSASALLFCRTDSVFLCMACDSKIHGLVNKHERVWMCEVCEQAPASVTCKADAAALCVACDRDIHSANPLARRHERVPVVPFYDTAESVVKSTASTLMVPITESTNNSAATTDSWISPNPIATKCTAETPDLKSMEFLLSEPDQLLGFDYPIPIDNQFSSGSDSVVPVQQAMNPTPIPPQFVNNSSENRFEIDFTRSSINSYSSSFPAPSLSHSVSSSSMDVGVVPDGGSMSESSYSFGRSVDLTGTTSGGGNQASQLLGLDREARVLRYREKRKNRKFEKTIRYASRKAYAETRPRIKGRFARRTEVDVDGEIDQIFGAAHSPAGFSITDARYGVVPSF